MLDKLFFLGVVLIPFSGIPGLPFLGEMKNELSIHIFILALSIFFFSYIPELFRSGKLMKVRLLPQFMVLFFFVVGISFALNFTSIFDSLYRERTGINKFITSTIVAVFGFSLAYLSYFVVGDKWKERLIKPVMISVGICAIYSIPEIGSWFSSGIGSVYTVLFKLTHDPIFGESKEFMRLTSVSFEPPAFANYAGFAWSWIYAGVIVSRGPQKMLYAFLWAVLTAMMILASSRTGVIVLSGSIIAVILLRTVFLPQKMAQSNLRSVVVSLLVGLFFLAIIIFADKFNEFVGMVVAGKSDSNLSRLASNTTAINMFKEKPLFGFGFGQYGFHGAEYMPSWGWYSWEIRSWFSSLGAAWPPVFSLYARFAAELGLLGVIIWTYIWVTLMYTVVKVSHRVQRITGVLPPQSHPIVLSAVCVLLSGIPNDSLRTPMMWITLGFGCRFISEMEAFIAKARAEYIANMKTEEGGCDSNGSVSGLALLNSGNEIVGHKHK